MFLQAFKAARVNKAFFFFLSMSRFACTKSCKQPCLDTPFLQRFNSIQTEMLQSGSCCLLLQWRLFSMNPHGRLRLKEVWYLMINFTKNYSPCSSLSSQLQVSCFKMTLVFERTFTKICEMMTLGVTGWRQQRNTVFAKKWTSYFFKRESMATSEWYKLWLLCHLPKWAKQANKWKLRKIIHKIWLSKFELNTNLKSFLNKLLCNLFWELFSLLIYLHKFFKLSTAYRGIAPLGGWKAWNIEVVKPHRGFLYISYAATQVAGRCLFVFTFFISTWLLSYFFLLTTYHVRQWICYGQGRATDFILTEFGI